MAQSCGFKAEKIRTAITFGDVLLVPKSSPARSRRDISTTTKLTRNISIEVPIVSSNMDTVTESSMAIAMARCGGIGIIHRFLSIEEQVEAVKRVKRAESYIIEEPYTISPTSSLDQIEQTMLDLNVRSLLVVQQEQKKNEKKIEKILLGIVTSRDIRCLKMHIKSNPSANKNVTAADFMTPRSRLIVADSSVSLKEASNIMSRHKIEKLPLVDASNQLKGLITGKDIINISKSNRTVDSKGRLRVGAAVGVKDGYIERAQALVEADVDVLVVDVAHGHSDLAIEATRELKRRFPNTDLISGNVATAEGVRDLIEAGADGIKVGVGGGSICITRIVTGSGVPQLTAVMECSQEAAKYGVPIMADGGIKTSGDLTKALAGGAATVMLGNLLAGTEESPGRTLIKDGKKIKVIRGMAGLLANISKSERDQREKTERDVFDMVPEGVEGFVPYRGFVADVIKQLVGGLQSGISYCGALSIAEMQKNAEFVRITGAGATESDSHSISKL